MSGRIERAFAAAGRFLFGAGADAAKPTPAGSGAQPEAARTIEVGGGQGEAGDLTVDFQAHPHPTLGQLTLRDLFDSGDDTAAYLGQDKMEPDPPARRGPRT